MRRLFVLIVVTLAVGVGALASQAATSRTAATPQARICIGSLVIGYGHIQILTTPEICIPAP